VEQEIINIFGYLGRKNIPSGGTTVGKFKNLISTELAQAQS
jgi:hypothetical protein